MSHRLGYRRLLAKHEVIDNPIVVKDLDRSL
jgi:hypothetical protein